MFIDIINPQDIDIVQRLLDTVFIDIINPQDIDIVQRLLDTVFVPPDGSHGLKFGHLGSINVCTISIG